MKSIQCDTTPSEGSAPQSNKLDHCAAVRVNYGVLKAQLIACPGQLAQCR